MQDWQQRVIDERNELQARLIRLHKRICSDDGEELLMDQAHAMQRYLSVLNERIGRFTGIPDVMPSDA